MIVKSGLEIPPCASHFLLNEFTRVLIKSTNSVIEMTWCVHRGTSEKNLVAYLHMINETLSHRFYPYSILIDCQMAHVLGVKYINSRLSIVFLVVKTLLFLKC